MASKFKCDYCGKEFDTRNEAEKHEKTCSKEEKEVWECEHCGEEFDTKKECEEHEEDCNSSNDKKVPWSHKKYRELLFEQIDEKDIIDEEMGNNRYLALTEEAVYFVSVGIASGHFFGKKVKSFPIDKITSVDIGKKIMASYLEITAAGMGGSSHAGAGYTEFNENLLFFPNNKLKRFQEIAKEIRTLMKPKKASNSNSLSESDELEKLHNLMKKGILTKKEFEQKKKKILGL
jgi:hypothetical protein